MNTASTSSILIASAALVAALGAAPACADSITVIADCDNTLIQPSPSELSLGLSHQIYVGRTGSNADQTIRRGLIRFPTAQIPIGSTVTSVQVNLYMSKGKGGAVTVALKRCLASWGEGLSFAFGGGGAPPEPNDATWTKRFWPSTSWTTPGGDFVPAASATRIVNPEGWYAFGSSAGLVADVQGWVNATETNFGWVVTGNETTPGTAKRFESHDTSAIPWKPTMTVVFTPPPPCVAADLNCNGTVDGDDLGTLLGQWGACAGCDADFNGDGVVDGDDLGALLGAWSS
ncbi:MAG: hypothetical protein FJ253_05805 [Phycisphaerae bacterium]|nr:hypothetical protein [Phycisphaerae bacterium]